MLSKECRRCLLSNRTHTSRHSGTSSVVCARPRLTKCAAASKQQNSSDQESWHLAPQQQQQLRTAVLATAVCVALVSNVREARASDNWIPRRHHRHIAERFTDTWADSIVEVCGLTGREPVEMYDWLARAPCRHAQMQLSAVGSRPTAYQCSCSALIDVPRTCSHPASAVGPVFSAGLS
jgi:hypothetical protein